MPCPKSPAPANPNTRSTSCIVIAKPICSSPQLRASLLFLRSILKKRTAQFCERSSRSSGGLLLATTLRPSYPPERVCLNLQCPHSPASRTLFHLRHLPELPIGKCL